MSKNRAKYDKEIKNAGHFRLQKAPTNIAELLNKSGLTMKINHFDEHKAAVQRRHLKSQAVAHKRALARKGIR